MRGESKGPAPIPPQVSGPLALPGRPDRHPGTGRGRWFNPSIAHQHKHRFLRPTRKSPVALETVGLRPHARDLWSPIREVSHISRDPQRCRGSCAGVLDDPVLVRRRVGYLRGKPGMGTGPREPERGQFCWLLTYGACNWPVISRKTRGIRRAGRSGEYACSAIG